MRDADVEGFIATLGAPDEYDPEADELHANIAQLDSSEITVTKL